MSWRNRVRQEVLAALKEHDVFSTMEQVADDIADAIPSPDERNGFTIIPSAQHEALMAAAKEIAAGGEDVAFGYQCRDKARAALRAVGIQIEGKP